MRAECCRLRSSAVFHRRVHGANGRWISDWAFMFSSVLTVVEDSSAACTVLFIVGVAMPDGGDVGAHDSSMVPMCWTCKTWGTSAKPGRGNGKTDPSLPYIYSSWVWVCWFIFMEMVLSTSSFGAAGRCGLPLACAHSTRSTDDGAERRVRASLPHRGSLLFLSRATSKTCSKTISAIDSQSLPRPLSRAAGLAPR